MVCKIQRFKSNDILYSCITMADEGTLATTAQVLLAIGANASADQILEANTNIWILQAEALIFLETDRDFVSTIGDLDANLKQALALCASSKAAMLAINQNQSNWSLAVAQSKLNVLDFQYNEALDRIKAVDL